MTRKILIALMIIAAFIVGIAALRYFGNPERAVMRYYEKHHTALEENLRARFDHDEALITPTGVQSMDKYTLEGHDFVVYHVTGRGLVPSSRYYGLIYSPDDLPFPIMDVDANPVTHELETLYPLNQISDTEWEWHEKKGDNGGLVRRIAPHWFFFETHF